MIRSAARRASGRGFRLACALLAVIGSGEGALAQPFRMRASPPAVPSPEARQAFEARIDAQASLLERDHRTKHLSQRARQDLVVSVTGHLLTVTTHRLGLALLSELRLPTPGGAAQAADDFAVLAALELGKNHFSDRIMMAAATSWLARMRGKETTDSSRTADVDGLNVRRAYRLVCLMAGADAARFKRLADLLPREMQRNCGADYERALRAWEIALQPHRPAADQPKTRIEVRYGPGVGHLAIYAQILRNLGFLETIAEVAASQVSWPAPLVLEMRSCELWSGATWTASERTLSICYELAGEIAERYRGIGRGIW
jgi:hypothetical protein